MASTAEPEDPNEATDTPDDEARGSDVINHQDATATSSAADPVNSKDIGLQPQESWETEPESESNLELGEPYQKPTPKVFTAAGAGEGELGEYHGESHLALRMSSACKGPLKDVDKNHPDIWVRFHNFKGS